VIRALADGLLAVVVAARCAACALPLDSPTRSVVCATCWGSIRPLTPPFCAVCGDPLASWREAAGAGGQCPRCRTIRSAISMGRAIGEYDGPLREILHALKYGGRRSIAPALSAMMRMQGKAVLTAADVVVPVPLHWRRRWRRGFNQAADLARGLGVPVVHALERCRNTPSQTDLPADRRRANVQRAFRVRRGARLDGACVVLVDDVSTTGATLEACAAVVWKAGAREVRTLTAARVVTRLRLAHPR
jgi:ComF family protein